MMLPGFNTALQPTSTPSPIYAPNLRKPVSNGTPSNSTVMLPGNDLKLDNTTPTPA